MSRIFILFLIALLPLRGWSVQGMGIQMGLATVAVSAQGPNSGMGEDCALHMQHSADQGAEQTEHSKPEHKGCQSCQLCMPLAAWQASNNVALISSAQAVPMLGSSRFVSADGARDAKPPIS